MKTRNRIITFLVSAAMLLAGLVLLGSGSSSAVTGNPVALANKHAIYTQPGAKGIAGAQAWDQWSGVTTTQVSDFTGTGCSKYATTCSDEVNWKYIDTYLPFSEWAKLPALGKRLQLTVSMLPNYPNKGESLTTLAECATGAYNTHWATLASNLVSYGLEKTVIRPGNEFNGNWFRWTARGNEAAYAECFRQLVDTMRAVPGQLFLFDWNNSVAVSPTLDYATAYPGDAYVDIVGLDIYDLDLRNKAYPNDPTKYPTGDALQAAQTAQWSFYYTTKWGLLDWSAFARAHGKALAVDEWAVRTAPDVHNGNDDPSFISRMISFIQLNCVWGTYFNIDDDYSKVKHDLMRTDTFPKSAAEYRLRAGDLALAA